MRLNEIEFLARHGVLRDVRTELDRDFRVLCLQSCYTSLLCSSGPARTVPFRPGRISDRVQIPDEPGSAEFVQDEPAKRLELVFRERGLRDQQHAVKSCVDQRQNHLPGQHGLNHCIFMSKSSPFLQPFCLGVSHRGVRLRASDAPHARPRGKRPFVSWSPVLHPSVSCCCSAACYVGVGSVWLVFLPSPHASCMSDITRGTRDTTPVLCRGFATRRRCTALWFGVDVGAARNAAASKVIHPRPKGASQ